MNKQFTFYWLDGTREVLNGKDVTNAFVKAGYSAGAMRALDFTCNGDNEDYEWVNGKWIKKVNID